jgi:hypothetical protein
MDHWISAGDGEKVAMFVFACVSFFLLARVISRRTDSSDVFQPPQEPFQDAPPPLAPTVTSKVQKSDVYRVVPSTKNVTVSLSDIWFDKFDVAIGPPDPKRFCAEMNVTIRISDFVEREWESAYQVATPEGMRDRMQSEHWATMFMPELLVVDHYDLDEICEAVIDHIRSHDPDAMDPPQDSNLDSVGS